MYRYQSLQPTWYSKLTYGSRGGNPEAGTTWITYSLKEHREAKRYISDKGYVVYRDQ